jgi:hypothetical protein
MENVHFDDIRPLMESLKRLPNGGSISLVYLLPPFARERLYTFPIANPADSIMDCHWTTLNFSNAHPDNRFNDAQYASEYIEKNYYRVGAPSVYGDLVLLMNESNDVKHSAVFLADNLVFTKYGNSYSQPWMITRIADMQAEYPNLKLVFFRKRTS